MDRTLVLADDGATTQSFNISANPFPRRAIEVAGLVYTGIGNG